MHQPKITAICHTYHRPNDLADAVENFRRQQYENKRLIVFDDGGTLHDSDDGVVKIVSSHHRSPAAFNHMIHLAATSTPQVIALWETAHLLRVDYLAMLGNIFVSELGGRWSFGDGFGVVRVSAFKQGESKLWTRIERTDLAAFWAQNLFAWSRDLFACTSDIEWKTKVFKTAAAHHSGTTIDPHLAIYRGAEPRDTRFVGTLRTGYSELATKLTTPAPSQS